MNSPRAGTAPADPHGSDVNESGSGQHASINVSVWLIRRDGQWTALAEEFNVVGMGPSSEAALRNMDELLEDYFVVVAEEGDSFENAHRPIPLRMKVSLRTRLALSMLRRLFSNRIRGDDSGRVHRLPNHAPC
jgi:hypothetical protein